MSHKYTFTPAQFITSSGVVDISRLLVEIGDSIIVTALENIVHDGDTIVQFASRLGTPEESVLRGIIAAHPGTPPVNPPTAYSILRRDPIFTDSVTGKQFRASLMLGLIAERELFNNPDSPIHVVGHTPLLGSSGSVTNLNTIHGKLGWHHQEVLAGSWQRPRDLLVYYGYPNSFNSAVNGWVNEKVAQDMAKYGVIVLGAGLEETSHPDYANTQAIVARVKALNPGCLVFGYVDGAIAQATFETQAGKWKTGHGVHGIFCDKFGYDYGVTRAQQNAKVDHLHGQSLVVFVNAWNTDHVLGTANDPSYPNTTFNPDLLASKLTEDDWVMLESLAVNTTSYSGNGGYASKADWASRVAKAITLRATHGVNFAAIGIVDNASGSGQDLADFAFVSSLMASLEAHGTSDTGYGGSSAAVAFWTRPDVSRMGPLWSLNPSVQVDAGDADVYHRYVEFGRFTLDFSAGAQDSTITKW